MSYELRDPVRDEDLTDSAPAAASELLGMESSGQHGAEPYVYCGDTLVVIRPFGNGWMCSKCGKQLKAVA